MGVYSIAAGGLVALGRAHFGQVYAVEATRYVLASSFLPIASVALGALIASSLAGQVPARLYHYSWVLAATVALAMAASVSVDSNTSGPCWSCGMPIPRFYAAGSPCWP